MSNTYRKKSFRIKGSYLSQFSCSGNHVRDGTPTRSSGGCENHGGCPYCESNRRHKVIKRQGDSIKNQLAVIE